MKEYISNKKGKSKKQIKKVIEDVESIETTEEIKEVESPKERVKRELKQAIKNLRDINEKLRYPKCNMRDCRTSIDLNVNKIESLLGLGRL